jgi:hypothetical protein
MPAIAGAIPALILYLPVHVFGSVVSLPSSSSSVVQAAGVHTAVHVLNIVELLNRRVSLVQ